AVEHPGDRVRSIPLTPERDLELGAGALPVRQEPQPHGERFVARFFRRELRRGGTRPPGASPLPVALALPVAWVARHDAAFPLRPERAPSRRPLPLRRCSPSA